MARLKDHLFSSGYRSGADDLIRELFEPALRHAIQYRRASGFFSSSVFSALAAGAADFFSRGGTMLLVTSPRLSAVDIAAIEAIYLRREKGKATPLVDTFADLRAGKISSSTLLGSLLRCNAITMYIARPLTAASHAIYHEKFAIFSDGAAKLAITGSGNESRLALVSSFERFELFRSWCSGGEAATVRRMETQFEALISNSTPGLEVLPLLEAYRRGWLEKRMTAEPEDDPATLEMVQPIQSEVLVQFPFPLFQHQERALKRWAASEGKGLLAMATGSGKTVTALSIASRLFDALGGRNLAVVIVAPFIHLVDQWIEVARQVGLAPIRCAETTRIWQDELATAVFALNAGKRTVLSVAVTSATLQSPTFQDLVRRIRTPMLLIGDEAHNYGTKKISAALPANAAYRVGLSATPEKWMDPEGSKRIRDYFGPIVDEYSMADALRDEILTPYVYHPLLVELDDDEADKYEEISAKLAKFGISDEAGDLSDGAKALLMKRARVLAAARQKLPLLESHLRRRTNDTHMLIYCGDGRLEGDADDMPPKQIDEVVAMVERMGMTCARYTAETPPDHRRAILRAFDEGHIQALIAIRCLDEGVDVPSTRTAFILSSSTNPRQFIQRRGRVLRRSPATGKTKAEIFDFFVIPTILEQSGEEVSRAMQAMLKRQLDRVIEFSSLALNGAAARRDLVSWTSEHGLMGLWGK